MALELLPALEDICQLQVVNIVHSVIFLDKSIDEHQLLLVNGNILPFTGSHELFQCDVPVVVGVSETHIDHDVLASTFKGFLYALISLIKSLDLLDDLLNHQSWLLGLKPVR